LRFIIENTLPKKVHLAMPGVYKNWPEFFKRFCEIGGVIEAMPNCAPMYIGKPSVSFSIEPDGKTTVIGAFDKFEAQRFVNCGMFYPQTNMSGPMLSRISHKIGSSLYQKGYMGYVTVDFITFPNMDPEAPPNTDPGYWAVDLNTELTDNCNTLLFFDVIMRGTYDENGEYSIEVQDKNVQSNFSKQAVIQEQNEGGFSQKIVSSHLEPKIFMVINWMHHPGLAAVQF